MKQYFLSDKVHSPVHLNFHLMNRVSLLLAILLLLNSIRMQYSISGRLPSTSCLYFVFNTVAEPSHLTGAVNRCI